MNRSAHALTSSRPPIKAAGTILRRHCACGRQTLGGMACEQCSNQQGLSVRDLGAMQGYSETQRPALRATHKGVTRCQAGKLVTTVNREHAAGHCVQVHEDAHASDPTGIEACQRFNKCSQREDGGLPLNELDPSFPKEDISNMCLTTYNNWHTLFSASTELAAYTAEAACLRETIDARCGAAKSRAGNIGGGIGAGVLGAGGGVGGYLLGSQVITPQLSSSASASKTGGIIGALLGSGIGAGLGWLVGKGLGSLAAGSQASETDCKQLQDELEECGIAIKEFSEQATTPPIPFEPDGRIKKDQIKGILAPGRADAQGQQPSEPEQQQGQAWQEPVATAARKDKKLPNPLAFSGDFATIPTLSPFLFRMDPVAGSSDPSRSKTQ